jgi:CheY-like chemotaxis protein
MDLGRPHTQPARPIVLLVEGDDETRALYSLALSGMGFEVVPAKDDADAFSRAWRMHPDVIVTDLPLSTDDGWFVRGLKQSRRTRDIPVVGAVSGWVQQGVCERARSNGFAALFRKPCRPDALAEGLLQVLNAQRHAPLRG